MKIVFMGTPDFAVPSLRMLAEDGYNVVGVFTNPDRPAGRGKKDMPPPVKMAAQSLGLPVFQFKKIRSPEGIAALRALRSDLFVTAAFGQILSQEALAVPPLGCVNVHASLLPRYRGAAPIQWSIINGECVTGITTMYTDEGIDTGDMILQRETQIGEKETGGELFERLSHLGAETLRDTMRLIVQGRVPRTPQCHAEATRVPMIKKTIGDIDWTASPERVRNLVRALVPWPVAYTHLGGEPIKIYEVREAAGFAGAPGFVLSADDTHGLVIAAGDGAVEVLILQAPGGKQMDARAFLRGHAIAEGMTCQRRVGP